MSGASCGFDARVRVNNTFKSSVMPAAEDNNGGFFSEDRSAKVREKIFKERPLTSKVQRASYQDSNIFGYKDEYSATTQATALREQSSGKTRYNGTFHSRVFGTTNGPDETERPPSRSRQEEKWSSTVFEGPIIEKSTRKKLGKGDSGTENLFGSDKVDLDNRSNNMPVLGTKKETKQWKPVRA